MKRKKKRVKGVNDHIEKEEMNPTMSCNSLVKTTTQTIKIEGHIKKKNVQEVKDHIERQEMNPTISCKGLEEINTPKTLEIEGHIKKKKDSTKIWKAEKPGNLFGNLDGMGFLAESNSEKAKEHSVSALKQPVWRNGRRPLQLEENRRATYRPFNQLENGNDSILTILDGESKQLIPVGIQSEHAYARSLARFAANLGPVAWKIAAQKIRRALPPGVSFGPGWVGDYEAPPRALLSHERISVASVSSSTTSPIVPGETKIKSNNAEDNPRLRDEGLPKNLISEGRTVTSATTALSARQLVSNSAICQGIDNCQSICNPQSEVIGHGTLNSSGDGRASLPSPEVKQGSIRSGLTVTTSSDLALAGTKFGSEVTQSRLLEMVSRNSTLMHGASLKQADGSRSIASLQVMKSENMTNDSDARGVARKASDASKRGCSSPGTNIAVTTVSSSLCNYQAGSRVLQGHQVASSQEHAKQDLNGLANLLHGKMLALHQRGSNLSANTPVLVHSSVSSAGPSIKRDDATVQAWIQSQNARLADADATSRVRLQDAPNPHMEQLRNRSISTYLIRWKYLPAEDSTWDDKNFIQKHQELLKR